MDLLRFMTAGSVDDGKSTFIGRLFHDFGFIPDDQLENISKEGLNLAHFTDGLREEREQGITIDVAYRYFETKNRKFIVADCPGHSEYTRNMVTAASHSDLIFILIDSSRDFTDQTIRHTSILRWLGKKNVYFLVNKMDLHDYSEKAFLEIKRKLFEFSDFPSLPVSALYGDNLLTRSKNMAWYKGHTVKEILETVNTQMDQSSSVSFPVQYVDEGYVLGQVNTGTIQAGMNLKRNGSDEIFTVLSVVNVSGKAINIKVDVTLARGDHLICSGDDSFYGCTWECEWCQLVDAPSSNLELAHLTQRVPVKSLSITHQYNLSSGDWEKYDFSRAEVNSIYRGILITKEKFAAEREGKSVLIDRMTGNTVAALILKNNL